MSTSLQTALETLFREFVDGPPGREAYMLNAGDVGLLRSLDTLSAEAASAAPPSGGASIAAHVDHLRYGLSLMNRWANGDPDPFATADWATSWTRNRVTSQEWATLRKTLADETQKWLTVLRTPREYGQLELTASSGASLTLGITSERSVRSIGRSVAPLPSNPSNQRTMAAPRHGTKILRTCSENRLLDGANPTDTPRH